MDDIYQNAWSETADPAATTFRSASPTTSWSPPSRHTASYDEEADLAAPSWSTGADIHWNEPSSPGFSWSQNDADAGWGPSTYEGISLGKSAVEFEQSEDPDPDTLGPAEENAQEDDVVSPPGRSPPTPRVPSPVERPPSPPVVQPVVPLVYEVESNFAAPPSPDGFGTFETGLQDDAVPSPAFAADGGSADPWGASAWADAKHEEEEEPVVDEWERAKQTKAKQDRRVPPELLSNILRQCEELCTDISPENSKEIPEQEAWRNDRRSGMDSVPGLEDMMSSFLPPLMLQPPPRFAQATVAKKMAASVKLTKNLPLTRGSPMSHYLAAKGSTAWEISVKERKEVVEDDVPIGWRIVEKAAAPVTDPAKDKKATGLFSFWGRRASQVPSPSNVSGRDSPSGSPSTERPNSALVAENQAESRHPSLDSVHSSMAGSIHQLPSPSGEHVPPQPPVAASSSNSVSSYASAPDPVTERSGTPPAPSAVSRFLNRFSRRTSLGGSPRSSLALSSDDLEFLSDIVPSAADDAEDSSADALERFVNTESKVPVLPPPLAPPPRLPRANLTSQSAARSSSRPPMTDDLEGLFGSLSSVIPATTSTISPTQTGTSVPVPPLAPPLVPSRPITPSSNASEKTGTPNTVGSAMASSSRPPSRLQTSTPPLSGFNLPPPPSFKSITPSATTVASSSKPKPGPLLMRSIAAKVEPGPLSASSTSSTAYETAESSPGSPTSSLPLGELYPHLAPPTGPSQPAESLVDKPSAHVSSLAPPTPASPPLQNPPLLRPPIRVNSALPATSSLFDDDDFSDFQSPVDQQSSPSQFAPSPVAKSPRTLAAAKAAASRAPTVRAQSAQSLSPFALPPPSGTNAGPSQAPSTSRSAQFTAFDDDDFADFQDSPVSTTTLHPTSSSSLFAHSDSDQVLLTPKNSNSFASLDDFLGGSSLATPTPPRVPAKRATVQALQPPPRAAPPVQPPPLQPPPRAAPPIRPPPLLPPPQQGHRASVSHSPPPSQPPPTSASMPAISHASSTAPSASSLLARRESKKRSHKAEHLHTLNLVEKAAAQSGKQWPAPPSPLPAAIPGPGGQRRDSLFSIMDEDTSAAAAVPSLAPSFSSPAVMAPNRPSSGMGMGLGMGNGNGNGVQQPFGSMDFGLSMSTSTTSNSSMGSSMSDLLWSSPASGLGRTSSPPIAPTAFGGPRKPSTTSNAQGSGLSAQDLSFFEGL